VATAPVLRVVEREWRVYKRLWRGAAFTSFVQPALYLAAMGLGLGSLVDQHSGSVSGLSYLEFVTPGLLIASCVLLTATESLWPVLAGVKWVRFYEGVVATPIEPGDLFRGFLVWSAIRTTITATAFLIVAAILGGVPSAWGVLAIFAAALTGATFAAPLGAFSITQETDLAFPIIMRLIILPLFLFSGTFFPIRELPGWLQPLAALSPLWHGVELARAATTGDFDFWPDLAHIVFLLACIAAGTAWGVRSFRKRLRA
jgi:lipooligosaccharide transport system permease protein